MGWFVGVKFTGKWRGRATAVMIGKVASGLWQVACTGHLPLSTGNAYDPTKPQYRLLD